MSAAGNDGNEEHERDHAADVLQGRPERGRGRLDLDLCRAEQDLYLTWQRVVVSVQGRGQRGDLDLGRVVCSQAEQVVCRVYYDRYELELNLAELVILRRSESVIIHSNFLVHIVFPEPHIIPHGA